MKEILFDFDEFRNRVAGSMHTPIHYSFRVIPDANGMFSRVEFRTYVWEGRNEILIFEKSNVFGAFDKEDIELFHDDCMELADELDATPGYYEEDQPMLAHLEAKEKK